MTDGTIDLMGVAGELGDAVLKKQIEIVHSLHSITIDLRLAAGAIEIVQNLGFGELLQGICKLEVPCDQRHFLYRDAVTLYARCFNTSRGRRRQSATFLIDSRHKSEHERIMALRDNATAHYGVSDWHSERVWASLGSDEATFTIEMRFNRTIIPSPDEVRMLRVLIGEAHDYFRPRLEVEKSKLEELLRSPERKAAIRNMTKN